MSRANLTHLLSKGRIGGMELRNRITVTAMGTNLGEEGGYCGERLRAFHAEQAAGGAAMVNVGVVGVAWPVGANLPNQLGISDDRFIPGLKMLGDAVHQHGAKFLIQLHHGGLVSFMDQMAERPSLVPSLPLPSPQGASKSQFTDAFVQEELDQLALANKKVPPQRFKEMTREDIQLVIQQFIDGAARAYSAGADGVELHGAHGYLLSRFISPRTNQRTDEYGGSLENRSRILVEIIKGIRERLGPSFAIIAKIDMAEHGTVNGVTQEDAIKTAQLAEAAGADAITASSYHDVAKLKLHSESNIPHIPGWNLPHAQQLKQALRIPVIASGRVEAEEGDSRIAQGHMDFLAMGRKLLADPHLPNKLMSGNAEAVRPCIYCYTCVSSIYLNGTVRCAVNPSTAFEREDKPVADGRRKRFVVVGGGPGGMAAAQQLDSLGHEVTLLEKSGQLGGTLRFASVMYEPNEHLLQWLDRGISKSKVNVKFNSVVTPELVRQLEPDGVLVATGARRGLPDIPGNHLPHVLSGDDLRNMILSSATTDQSKKVGLGTRMTMKLGKSLGLSTSPSFVRSASKVWMPFGKKIVIIGGELVGLELAEFLCERGREVTVVDDLPRLGGGLQLVRRMRLMDELKEHGVTLVAGAKDIEIEEKQVRFLDSQGESQVVLADQVIIAKGASADHSVATMLRSGGFDVLEFGDCSGIGYIEGAMRGAWNAAKSAHETGSVPVEAVE